MERLWLRMGLFAIFKQIYASWRWVLLFRSCVYNYQTDANGDPTAIIEDRQRYADALRHAIVNLWRPEIKSTRLWVKKWGSLERAKNAKHIRGSLSRQSGNFTVL